MIIILTGSTVSGKTDTAWAVVSLHARIVFLENDCFAYRKPFDPSNREDLITMYDQLLLNVQFHRQRGIKDYVVTLSPPMAVIFPEMKFRFEDLDSLIFPFMLIAVMTGRQDGLMNEIVESKKKSENGNGCMTI